MDPTLTVQFILEHVNPDKGKKNISSSSKLDGDVRDVVFQHWRKSAIQKQTVTFIHKLFTPTVNYYFLLNNNK